MKEMTRAAGRSPERKIIVAATFREFAGTENDALQLLFLRSLKKQSYTNWIAAVTLFGEKNVGATLEREGIPHVLFEGDARGERFSVSDLLSHAVECSDRYPGSIIVFSTGDIVLDENLLQSIADAVNKSGPLTCGITSPHVIYPSLSAYEERRGRKYFWTGLDVMFFDSGIFASPLARTALREYRNDGLGGGDFYMLIFCLRFAKRLINIYPLSRLTKIANDRAITNETPAFRIRTKVQNLKVIRKLAKDLGIREENENLWFLPFHFFPSYSLSPIRLGRWLQTRFRIHVLGIRYHINRILKATHLPLSL